ncbi:MAG: hypothetical protein KAX33_12505 [Candidatus Lokiarchaeota archaeon]|nr:hypothetical protein [Candidatus Lokiarchaeota archaeon]
MARCCKTARGTYSYNVNWIKLDLKKYRSVSTEEGLKAAKQFGLFSFIELSSKSGENVEIAIKQMTKILLADINKKEMIHL